MIGEVLPLAFITIRTGRVSPQPGRLEVKQGEEVRLSITSDQPEVVVVDGRPDVRLPLRPGKPATFTLPMRKRGEFRLSTKEGGLLLTTLVVT